MEKSIWPMKIIRLSTFLDYGGIESKMVNLSVHQDAEKEWIFVAIGKGGYAEHQIMQNNKKVVCFNLPHKIVSLKALVRLYVFFKREHPDVVHTSGSEANFHGVLAAKLANIPVIVAEEIGIPNQSKFAVAVFKIIYRMADFVVGESLNVVNNLNSIYSIKKSKLYVVPNFINIDTEIEVKPISPIKSNTIDIISVSRIEPIKNILGVINVVEKLLENGFKVKYTIVGDGSLLKELKEAAKQRGLLEGVFFVGYQSDLSFYYKSADLFILNSFSEGFSNSLLEAMLYRLPCITTNVGAAEQIIENGINGWITQINNELELYNSIVNFISLTQETRDIIGLNARKTVMNNYSLDGYLFHLNKIYNNGK
jgi:glycosyltransferase involved in cell wall biosynthesis